MDGTRWYLVSLKHIIDLGLQRQFSGSTDEVSFGSVTMRCNPQAFQDDIVRLANGMDNIKAGNVKLSQMLGLKGLDCHPTKKTFITIGTKK